MIQNDNSAWIMTITEGDAVVDVVTDIEKNSTPDDNYFLAFIKPSNAGPQKETQEKVISAIHQFWEEKIKGQWTETDCISILLSCFTLLKIF